MKVARKFIVSGEVQGVGFRFFTQRVAARHQVTGYVRNLSDGRVEALAQGTASAVEAFRSDIATGPIGSVVTGVEEINLELTERFPAFRIER